MFKIQLVSSAKDIRNYESDSIIGALAQIGTDVLEWGGKTILTITTENRNPRNVFIFPNRLRFIVMNPKTRNMFAKRLKTLLAV